MTAHEILQMFYDADRIGDDEFNRKHGFGWMASLRDHYAHRRAAADHSDVVLHLSIATHLSAHIMLEWLAREALATLGLVQR
ncbi:MAG: hypothetical protein WC211_01340 [Dehalococcoidia bacterium]